MLRTQILLSDEDRRLLDREAHRTGRSISALIRDAVSRTYGGQRDAETDREALRRAFGAWRDRDDDGAVWVDRRRSDRRLGGGTDR